MKSSLRLDEWLLKKKYAKSIRQSQGIILSGKVLVNGRVISQTGFPVQEKDHIRVKEVHAYYSRSALKLKGVLAKWDFKIKNKSFLDIGAAHGGFAQVLLEEGACRLITLDLSYGQLHPDLRSDERVFVMERKNIYSLRHEELPFLPDGFTADLSFTTLKKLIPYLKKIIPHTEGICLFKPQFEAESFQLEKGIVKKKIYIKHLLDNFQEFLVSERVECKSYRPASITGKKGNQEYLFWVVL